MELRFKKKPKEKIIKKKIRVMTENNQVDFDSQCTIHK